ncbi:ACAD11, partial [Symbiodinium pilosum]
EPPPPSERRVKVHVSDIQGPLRTISADTTWLILDVKKQLERSEKVARQRQRLLWKDRDADDLEPVCDLIAGAERLDLVLVVCMDKHFKLDLFVGAFRSNWRTLQFASSSLRANPKIVKMALHQDWHALAFASPELRADFSLARLAVRTDGLALQVLPARMQNDRPLVLTAVQQNWRALQYASIRLRGDRDVVLEAVKQDTGALEFASQRLRGDRTVVLLAVRISGAALRFASPKLQADLEVVIEALQQDSKAITYTAPEIRTDPKLHAAVRGNSEVLRFLGYDNRERKNTEQELFDMHMGIFKCPYDDETIAAALRGERFR